MADLGTGASSGPLAESGRVEAFSDGVFPVAITLLVLGLTIPAHRGTMRHDLLAQWPAYMAYLASFAYVGVIWVNHHQLFARIARVNAGLLWRNLALLFTTSVLPFPTGLSARRSGSATTPTRARSRPATQASESQRRPPGCSCSTSCRVLPACLKTKPTPPCSPGNGTGRRLVSPCTP